MATAFYFFPIYVFLIRMAGCELNFTAQPGACYGLPPSAREFLYLCDTGKSAIG